MRLELIHLSDVAEDAVTEQYARSLVTKKGAFPDENALLKLLYLRITELYKKWNDSKVPNWAMVRNQLSTNEKISARIEKYEHTI